MTINPSNVLKAALSRPDIMAMAFLVMMEAAKSARQDLKEILEGIKSLEREAQENRRLALLLEELTRRSIPCPPD